MTARRYHETFRVCNSKVGQYAAHTPDSGGRTTHGIMRRAFKLSRPPVFTREALAFAALIVLIVATFLFGGSAREDVASLIILRPLSVICFMIGLWCLPIARARELRWLLALFGLIFVSVLIQLIPLPTAIWSALPGHRIASEARIAGEALPWRPISVVPWRTWNSFYSLFLPAAALLLAAACDARRYVYLLYLLLGMSLVSALVGVVQLLGPADGPFYFYRITNFGAMVGLFANRNHYVALIICMFPMLAAFAALQGASFQRAQFRQIIGLAIGLLLVPLVLVAGSRAGLILLLPALASNFLFRSGRGFFSHRSGLFSKAKARRAAIAGVLLSVVAVAALTVITSRATSLDRLINPDRTDNSRWDMLWPTIGLGRDYFPFGSGAGTFVEAYQVIEPREHLVEAYRNHAHNDFVEVAATCGLLAFAVALFAAALWVVAFSRRFAARGRAAGVASDIFARLGLTIAFFLVVLSAFDYPLRVPILAMLVSIAAVWASVPIETLPLSRRRGGRASDRI